MTCVVCLLAASLHAQQTPVNRIVLGGDVMLARHVWQAAQARKDASWSFRKIADVFRSADLAFVNLESPFAERPPYFEDRMVFRANPSMIEGLKLAGIDVVSTANNHARDAGEPGMLFTLALLRKHGIEAVGSAAEAHQLPGGVILERNGVRFGFLAYTFDQRNGNFRDNDPRIAMLDAAAMRREVLAMRPKTHVVIVSMHAGWEYHRKPNPVQIAFARAAIDAGAAVVVGHHPHIVQPVETYNGGAIFYSLGNLIFDQMPRQDEGAIAELTFTGNRLTSQTLRPIRIRNMAPELR
ncbi:MAG: CapA family protein [Candidatus Solibacter usitatus]|nr:CapA family protein [Candidatus Solibacter usitatus]